MSAATARKSALPAAPARSPRLFELFRWYGRRYVARHVHAVRLARGGFRPGADDPAGPVLVVMNHPSWWDPMIGLVLSELWPGRRHFAPIDAAGLAKYRFLGRLGFFGIEPGTPRGARQFLRQGLAALADPAAMLWVTAQGRFADPRERPTRLKDGVGHLAHRMAAGCVLPLALEYAFWDERTPEALARFGPPIPAAGGPSSPGAWTACLQDALQATQDDLAADAISRDPARFETILTGAAGVGGVYDLWRRLNAVRRGDRFVAEHGGKKDSSADDADDSDEKTLKN